MHSCLWSRVPKMEIDRQEYLPHKFGKHSSSAIQKRTGPYNKGISRIQRNVEFNGKLLGIERAASKVAATYIECRNYAPAVVHFDHDRFRRLVFFNVDFAKAHTALFQERLRAPAIRAPRGGVHRDGFHIPSASKVR